MCKLPSHEEIIDVLRNKVTFDIAEDVASDVILDILVGGMPDDMKSLITYHKNKNMKMHILKKHASLERLSELEREEIVASFTTEDTDFIVEVD
jgi:hypothetical protein